MSDLVVLGAAGDLTSRYLVPALAELESAGTLPDGFTVTGVDRADWDDTAFRCRATARLDRPPPRLPARLRYRRGDVTDAVQLRAALETTDAAVVVYLALPPAMVPGALQALRALPLHPDSRVVVEKPFGDSFESARGLNVLLNDVVTEDRVFRVDHFLGKQTVQNILGLRFANRIFEAVWNAQHIERVDITWDETLALEERAGYYDHAGALRDMVQNHLLQLLCLLAMEPPATLDARALRDRKIDVLRAVRRPTIDDVRRHTRRARYRAGTAGGVQVSSYVDEPGIDPTRETETFAEITVWIDNWRWAGVPFTLRSGKALATDRHEIEVRFRSVPHLAFDEIVAPEPNLLRLAVGPDRVDLGLNLNGAGNPFRLERATMTATLAPQELSAYARLLLDVFDGDPILSIRADEAEAAWLVIEPILDGWRSGVVPLLEYDAGSNGPMRC